MALLLALMLGGTFANMLSRATMGGFPTCDSDEAKAEVMTAYADGPLFKLRGVKLIDLTQVTTVYNTQDKLQCHGIASLTDDTSHGVLYSFDRENGQVIVHANLDAIP